MFRKLTWPACALALMVGVSACELDTINPNQPDRARALAGPDDVETLIASAFIKVWEIGHYWTNSSLHGEVVILMKHYLKYSTLFTKQTAIKRMMVPH